MESSWSAVEESESCLQSTMLSYVSDISMFMGHIYTGTDGCLAIAFARAGVISCDILTCCKIAACSSIYFISLLHDVVNAGDNEDEI